MNFQIEIKNVEEMAQKIKENWYKANNKKYGNKEFLIQDPDGYLLRLSEDIGIEQLGTGTSDTNYSIE